MVKNGGVNKNSYSRRVKRKAGRQTEAVGIEDDQSTERESTREDTPSSEPQGEEMEDLMASVEDTEDPAIKQEDSDQEEELSELTAPEAKTTLAKNALGSTFAGVSKRSGSSRRGVPRKAVRASK